MKYKFYVTSKKAWDAMLKAISSAQKSIYLEMYIFIDNTKRYNFFEIIKQKARAGVRVKIIIDSLGSFELKPQAIEEIKASGIELMFFSYWLQRTHKKILVVDEKIAFLGGVNIHKIFRKWNDLQMRFEGPIVRSIIRSFARTYQRCGGKDPDILGHINQKGFLKKTKLWILEHWQLKSKRFIKQYYRESIKNAKKHIVITTPYFAPAKWLIGELHHAVLRGVAVEVILPKHIDSWIMNRVNYFYISRLHHLGIKFYLEKKMNHAKAMLIDDTEGAVGSQNIDPISFEYNVEAGVVFREKDMVKSLKRIMDNWKRASDVFESPMKKPSWFDYLLAPFISIFQSII
jgi:cardiolipin synthase